MATEFNTGADASLNEAVKSRYEANADTNAFTDGEKTKLAGVEDGADANEVVIFDAGGDYTAARPSHPANKQVQWFNTGGVEPTNIGAFDQWSGAGFGVAFVTDNIAATYTLSASDVGRELDCDSGSAQTVTIPAEATEDLGDNAQIVVNRLGAGVVTVIVEAGVSLDGAVDGSAQINAQYAGVVLRKRAGLVNTWFARGVKA